VDGVQLVTRYSCAVYGVCLAVVIRGGCGGERHPYSELLLLLSEDMMLGT